MNTISTCNLARAAHSALRLSTVLLLLSVGVLLSACGSSSKSFVSITTGTPVAGTLTSLSVEPVNATLPRGLTRQFTATALYSDGTKLDVSSSVTWSSSATNIATINTTGVLTAVNLGATTVTAAMGAVTGSTTLTVSAATLVSIEVTPVSPTIAKGTVQPLTATGVYTDYSTQDITTTVTWTSSNPLVATISNAPGSAGFATGVSGGTATLTATLGAATGSTVLTVSGAALLSISVTPANPSAALGARQQFTATGTYTDGTQQNLTTTATWSSSSTAATISNAPGSQGLATAAAVGTATISAASGGLTGSTTFTVTAKSLLLITVTPVNPTIPAGLMQPFVATGTYSDGTTVNLTAVAVWNSATPTVATISNVPATSGTATGLMTGTSAITATVGLIVSAPVTLTVTPAALVSIAVTPVNPTVVNGATLQFIATGTYADGTTAVITTMVTWNSATPGVATISNAAAPTNSQGLATAVAPGTTLITATFPGTSITSPAQTLTVKNAFAYATNIEDNSVSQYSIGNGGALTPLPAGPIAAGARPFAIAITAPGTFAYVANSNGNNLALANTISQYSIGADGSLAPLTPATIAAGNNPNSVTIDPSGSYVYVSNYGEQNVSQFVIGATGVLTIPVGGGIFASGNGPAAIAINRANTYAYVANFADNTVSEYSIMMGGALVPLAGSPAVAGLNPNYLIVDPTGRFVYVANYSGPGGISEYSIGAGGVLVPLNPAIVATGLSPRFIAIDSTGRYAYSADSGSSQVSQFTIANGILTPMTPAAVSTGGGSAPNGVTIDATGRYLYVADRGAAAISQFIINPDGSLASFTPLNVAAGAGPTSIATTP